MLQYLDNTAFIVYSNEGRFAPEKFADPIDEISSIKKRQIDETSAHWYNMFVEVNQIQDEVSLVSWGQSTDYEYYTISMGEPNKSMFATWPNEYKFTGIELQFSLDLGITERSSYSLLEWLGDCGGLLDALKLIAAALINPISRFFLSLELLTGLFRLLPSKRNDLNRSTLHSQTDFQYEVEKNFDRSEPIKPQSLFGGLYCSK